MGLGIYVAPDDGSPAIELYDNVRVPLFCQSFINVFVNETYNVANYVPGAQLIVVPIHVSSVSMPMSPGIIPNFNGSKGFRINGGSIYVDHINKDPHDRNRRDRVSFHVFQILPAVPQTYGITLVNSTQLLDISDAGFSLQPIYRNHFTLSGRWGVPTIPGYPDKSRYIIFGNWSDSRQVVECTNDARDLWVRCTHQTSSYGRDVNGSVDFRIVIFYAGEAPAVSHAGINIFSPAGACTFSTAKPPFIMKGLATPTNNWSAITSLGAGIALPMIPLYRPGTSFHWLDLGGRIKTNLYYMRGLMMNGMSVATGPATKQYEFTYQNQQYNYEVTTPVTVPVIDAANYM